MGFKHQRMLLAVCREHDVSQIAFPLHIVIIAVISLFLRVSGDFRVLSPFMGIGLFYSPGVSCLVKNQVGNSCALNKD